MNKEKAKEFLPLITALAEGRTVQVADLMSRWFDEVDPMFNSCPEFYRIKPETIEEWLGTLPEPYRALALQRREEKPYLTEEVASLMLALHKAFIWRETQEDYDFWSSVSFGNSPDVPRVAREFTLLVATEENQFHEKGYTTTPDSCGEQSTGWWNTVRVREILD